MAGSNGPKPVALFNVYGRYLVVIRPVVVARAAGEEARVQSRSDNEGYILVADRRENLVDRVAMIDQRILRSAQTDVEIGDLYGAKDRFRPVHADAPGFDDPFLAHACQ